MSGRSLLVLVGATLTACHNSHGFELDVDVATSGATSVEVVLADFTCNGSGSSFTCAGGSAGALGAMGDGVSWGSSGSNRSNALPAIPGEVHEQITDQVLPLGASRRATFLLDLTTLPAQISRIAILALDARGQPVTMQVLKDVTLVDNARVPVTLSPMSAALPSRVQSHLPAANVWTSPAANHERCIAWFSSDYAPSQANADFIVPADDHDCDGYLNTDNPDLDCNDYWYMSSVQGGAACATRTGSGPFGSACVLGSAAGCSDGGPQPAMGCIPNGGSTTETCMPDVVCDQCQPLDDTCYASNFMPSTMPAFPEIGCTLTYTSAGACTGAIPLYTSDNGSAMFTVYDTSLIPMPVPMVSGGSGDQFILTGTPAQVSILTTPTAAGSGVTATLQYDSGELAAAAGTFSYFLSIEGSGAQAMIPFFISVPGSASPTCMNTCTLIMQASDEVWTCAQ